MGQTPACCLEMNELQGTHGLGGESSETLPIPGLVLLCWPGFEPCPVAPPPHILQISPCFFAPALLVAPAGE